MDRQLVDRHLPTDPSQHGESVLLAEAHQYLRPLVVVREYADRHRVPPCDAQLIGDIGRSRFGASQQHHAREVVGIVLERPPTARHRERRERVGGETPVHVGEVDRLSGEPAIGVQFCSHASHLLGEPPVGHSHAPKPEALELKHETPRSQHEAEAPSPTPPINSPASSTDLVC